MLNPLCKLIDDLEKNNSLYEPNQLAARIKALDHFDVFNLEMPPLPADPKVATIYCHAKTIQARLEAANVPIYQTIRRDIISGRGVHALFQWMPASNGDNDLLALNKGEGYDYLDELIAGVLQLEEPGPIILQPTAEMVLYQPTPARHIFDLFNRTDFTEDDLLIDLGSGLGHVPLLTGICTDARSIGVEFEPAYVHSARQTAAALNLKRVTFLQQDARTADFSEGTVFYLYTPFTGAMLRSVLDSLRGEAAKRDIRICTFGPCTTAVAQEDWLQSVGSPRADRISIFRSSNTAVISSRQICI